MPMLPIDSLPVDIRLEDAVEAASSPDLDFIAERLRRSMSVLVECDKELALYLYLAIRDRLKRGDGPGGKPPKMVVVDGRPRSEEEEGCSALILMLRQLTAAIRGTTERCVVVLLHLDVLATTHSNLTVEARELIPLLYENPEAVVLAFRDVTFPLPRVIEGFFAVRREIVGIPRDALAKLVTQREARAIAAEGFDPVALYKYVSGQNPVRVRRLMAGVGLRRGALVGRSQARSVYAELRRQTVSSDFELPSVDLERDIGGYAAIKQRLREDLLDLLGQRDRVSSETDLQTIEGLLPRGIILHGPPGTGKTHFAKAIATALDATLIIVSGPELKSKWVGESEENLRRVFRRARQSAPAIIVFDELDAFAHARGTYEGSGVEHSMVNQLLTEMDGFRANEMLFVVGTTNFLESLDAALLRPGRFEFLVEIPAPDATDRRAIVEVYDSKLQLGLSDALKRHLVRRTEGMADREHALPYTGDHVFAVCRALKRQALRTGNAEFCAADIDRALERKTRTPIVMSAAEEHVVAVHESGHALLAMLVERATPPERISIAADLEGSLGYVQRAVRARAYTLTAQDLRADICVALGGYCAERLVFGDVSVGACADLRSANEIARSMVEEHGMGDETGVQVVARSPRSREGLATTLREKLDRDILSILLVEQERAETLLADSRHLLDALTAALLEQKVLEGPLMRELANPQAHPQHKGVTTPSPQGHAGEPGGRDRSI